MSGKIGDASITMLLLAFGLFCLQAPAQTFKVLHQFNGQDGYTPFGGVVLDKAGYLYGVTFTGGKSQKGTIYKVAADGTTSVLHTFQHQEGCCALSTPLLDRAGNLFGTNSLSPTGPGSLWELRSTGKLAILVQFNDLNGSMPMAGVVRDSAGNLFGTTTGGGGESGAVYAFNLARKQETVLHYFLGSPDGAEPSSTLYRDGQGNLYGTTHNGGVYDFGTVFKVDTSGQTTVLYSFTGGTDGKWTTAGVIQDSQGNLYGTVPYGGIGASGGIIFKLNPTGAFTILHTFTGLDGSMPLAPLIADSAGNMYGTTRYGGAYGAGNVFKIDISNNVTNLYSFRWQGDGAFPFAPVTLDQAGNIYGTASQGGNANCDCGVVFKITP